MNQPEVLFLSHCVPWPPDKGEKIRAFRTLRATAQVSRVHLVCLALNQDEMHHAQALRDYCASVTVEPRNYQMDLARAATRFLLFGRCLNEEFYFHPRLKQRVESLSRERRLSAALVSTVVMAQYLPAGLRFVLDMHDVDSEKWFQYARFRFPAVLFRAEARRLRELEILYGSRAASSFFTTRAEAELYLSFAGNVATGVIENGVDTDYFNPDRVEPDPELAKRDYLAFVGSMDYYPNAQAAIWFAHEVLPTLRQAKPGLEFLTVGRNPTREVRALSALPGVQVTGAVPDVRPYLKHSRAQVVPLQIARGIQNKVLEALAMGTRVLASPAVGCTFGRHLPIGVVICDTPDDYAKALNAPSAPAQEVRQSAVVRFNWDGNLAVLTSALESVLGPEGTPGNDAALSQDGC